MSTGLTLKQRIQNDMKEAMRAHEKQRLDAIRLILAAIKQIEVDERIEADDSRVLAILDKMLKQRRDSIEQYQKGNRPDLAELENFEVDLIQHYLPAQLSDAEITALINQAIAETAATSAKDMGKIMAVLKPQIQGRADMTAVSAKVKERLG